MHIASFQDVHTALQAYWPGSTTRHRHGLAHMHELLKFLGDPHEKLQIIHVAGTSGKTSTAYYIAALLRAAGKQVGLTVSPHVDEVNERVQINLTPLPEAVFAPRFGEFLRLVRRSGVQPNYFELFIAFAFWEFAARKLEYAVVEVGIGGLLDSTNVATNPDKVCVITDIGFDHTAVLGKTLPEIALQKAGIIHRKNVVFCYNQSKEVMGVIRHTAADNKADLRVLEAKAQATQYVFLPLFQQRNFGLAWPVAQYILQRDHTAELSETALETAARTPIPARMEQYAIGGKTLILDAAHNSQKFHALLASVHAQFADVPVAAMVRMRATEEHTAKMTRIMGELFSGTAHIIVTSLSEEGELEDKRFAPEQAQRLCREAGYTSFEIIPDPKAAFDTLLKRPEPVLVVAGSFYLLNHIRPLLTNKDSP